MAVCCVNRTESIYGRGTLLVAQLVEVLRYKPEGHGFLFLMMSYECFIDIKSFRSHYGPGVDSASNRNEYREYFVGVKAVGV